MCERSYFKNIRKIEKLLVDMYGTKQQIKLSDPIDELILTVLSQNTNDVNRDRAFKSLKSRFPKWKMVADANPGAVAKEIKIGGLANIKSKRIVKILRQIEKGSRDLSLEFLKDKDDSEIWEYLTSFDGVGPKTASCVLMFSFGKAFMPVDTHVFRVGKRLNIIPDELNVEQAHIWFKESGLKINFYQLHLNMIEHGRKLCRPGAPKCEDCLLVKYCNFEVN